MKASTLKSVSKPFLSGVLSEEGSPPPSSPPGIFIALNRPSTPLDDLPIKGSFAPDPPVRGLFIVASDFCKTPSVVRNKKAAELLPSRQPIFASSRQYFYKLIFADSRRFNANRFSSGASPE
jgi:hypothetical protein